MATSRGFTISIAPFDGDPLKFDFFEEQVTSVCSVNSLSPEEALMFTKSKLVGAALQFYIESPILKEVTCHKQLLKAIKDFFVSHAQSAAVEELKQIIMLPNENIQSVAHRITKLTKSVYPSITDKSALQQIKLVTFMQAIPNPIKVKLVEKQCKSFDDAVEHAKSLFEQYSKHNILNYLVGSQSTLGDVTTVTREVNLIRHNNEPDKNKIPESGRKKKHQYRSFTKDRNNSVRHQTRFSRHRQNFNQFQNKRPFRCSYCNMEGHTANFCRKLKRDNIRNQNTSSWQQNRSQQQDKLNTCFCMLNSNVVPANSQFNEESQKTNTFSNTRCCSHVPTHPNNHPNF